MSLTLPDGYTVTPDGRVIGRRGSDLKPEIIKGGYHRVTVQARPKRRHILVHVLVAAVHLGPRPEGYEVNHKDGNKANNAVSNLEYVTPGQNVRHSLNVLGVKRAKGSRNGQARLTEQQVLEMRASFADGGVSRSALARVYGVSISTACRAIKGERWSHVEAAA